MDVSDSESEEPSTLQRIEPNQTLENAEPLKIYSEDKVLYLNVMCEKEDLANIIAESLLE
jgi:hypothetical protein